MTVREKLVLVAEALDVEEDEISMETVLEELEDWSSMTKLSLIVMFDDEFDLELTSKTIKSFHTVGDIINAMP